MPKTSVLNWVALAALVVATGYGLYWPWGMLFLFWAVQSLMVGSVHLLAPIHRRDEPALYWAVKAMWVLFGLWYMSGILPVS